MSSDRKIRANQRNALASTGPKTSAGRARVARNAVRHGLNVSLNSDPTLIERAKALAHKIAGPAAQPHLQDLAMEVAEAQIEVQRAHSARHRIISLAPNRTDRDRLQAEPGVDPRALPGTRATARREARKSIETWEGWTQQLFALDRYLRHAYSRRKLAIRALETISRRD